MEANKCGRCGDTSKRVMYGLCMDCRTLEASEAERRREESEHMPSGKLPSGTKFTLDDFIELAKEYKESVKKLDKN